ncbi:MAG: hypothetical protein ACOC5T_05200 [Elusimicrobiota bacterium]
MTLSQGYYKYMNSREWYRKRSRWLEQANYECGFCSRSQTTLQVHHLTYDNFRHEKDEDIIVLCKACHKHSDEIRKMLLGFEDEPLIKKLIEERGYPHNMKRKTRKHVLRFKKKLKKAKNTIERARSLSPRERKRIEEILEKSY